MQIILKNMMLVIKPYVCRLFVHIYIYIHMHWVMVCVNFDKEKVQN